MKTQPDLGITNPYALDETQFAAAIDLLKVQRANVGEYWSDYLAQAQSFTTGDSVVGTSWQVITNVLQGEGAPIEAVLPEEGSTGWSDTWMISATTEAPTCAYLWLEHMADPETNAMATGYFGEAPRATLRARSVKTARRSTLVTPSTPRSSGIGRPDGRVPRRSHRCCLYGLPSLDTGLAGNQGLVSPRSKT